MGPVQPGPGIGLVMIVETIILQCEESAFNAINLGRMELDVSINLAKLNIFSRTPTSGHKLQARPERLAM